MSNPTISTPAVPAAVKEDAAWLVRSFTVTSSTRLARAERYSRMQAAGMSLRDISAYLKATVTVAPGDRTSATPAAKTVAQYVNVLATLDAPTPATFDAALRAHQTAAAGSKGTTGPKAPRDDEQGPADADQNSALLDGLNAERAAKLLVRIVQASARFSESDRAILADMLTRAAVVVKRPQPVRDGRVAA